VDGFKDSTKMKYMGGGMVGGYAKGGDVKMPMKKAKAGMKMPMKKGGGGDVKMPSPAESAASGNRMAEMEAKEERMLMRRAPGVGSMTERDKREMKKRVPATRREPMLPPVGDSVASGNRMSAQEGAEMREMTRRKKGGLAVMPKGKC
jgi:hypothetical protein